MKPIIRKYNLNKYKFRELVQEVFGCKQLENLHLTRIDLFPDEKVLSKPWPFNENTSAYHRVFYDKLDDGWEDIENSYELFLLIINSFFGKFILIGFTWSMNFHLLSGIRHLVWDLGYGFEIKTANISGIIVIITSLVVTVIFWLFARGFI